MYVSEKIEEKRVLKALLHSFVSYLEILPYVAFMRK